MDQLRAMKVFAKVVEEGGFARAATALGLAPPVVTRVVADLEAHLGARLLNRTTRRIALTDVGEAYLERVRAILIEVEEAEALAGESTREPRGHLRVLAPPALAAHQIARHLPAFRARHPQVTIELHAPGPVETIDEDFDVTLISTRHRLSGEFVARRLACTEVVTCASPEYLDRHGRPSHPRDLLEGNHAALLPPIPDVLRGMTYHRGPFGDDEPGGDSVTLATKGMPALVTSHIDTLYSAALHGLGIAGLPSFVVAEALVERALERVLPEWRLFRAHLWAALPTRKHLPMRTRAFVDFLVQTFGGEERDPWLEAAGCPTTTA
jgi:DNA-binding transcriptional LysR family regulator